MSQQYFYNGAQFTAPSTFSAQSVTPCYTASVPPPPAVTVTRPPQPQSSAHRSQAPVTYTYPTNTAVMASSLVPGQQTTLVGPSLPAKVGTSFVIANGPASAQPNSAAYTVTTSYFQQLPGQTQAQQQNMAAQAAAVAAAAQQQANLHAAMAAANNSRNRRNVFDGRFQQFRKNAKAPRSALDSQVFYCDVCKISCAGPQTYKEHLGGQKHKKRAAGNNVIEQITVTKGSQQQLRCELCDVTCTGVDAYQAHIRGTKHQKTFKLHQRLGKPIPCADPLVVKLRTTTEVNDSNTGVVKISAGPKINFISSAILKTVGDDAHIVEKVISNVHETTTKVEEHVDLNSLQEKITPPVGNEYIETTLNESGKVVQFFCKLCSCKFNDPHAKEMHLKGRRHRLQYKKKVDPSLVVDNKIGTSRNWKIEEDKMRQKQQREEFWRRRDMQSRMREMQRLEYSNISNNNYNGISHGMRHFETLDDKHVSAKHTSVCPTDEELQGMQTMVVGCEKALRHISEILFEESVPKDEKPIEEEKEDVKKTVTTPSTGDKMLCGAMRVGPLAKGLLLRGELVVSLVLLCSKWPTFSLMNKVLEKLPEKLQELLPNDNIEVSLNTEYQCLLVSRKKEPEMHCYIHFTSSVVREEKAEGLLAVQPEDGLDRKRCLDALASLRHTKWFQAKVSNNQPCLTIIRILRNLCQRVPTWGPLSSWAIELLTEKVVSSETIKLTPGCALRRFFECVASGVLLSGGPGLRDPCEKEVTDASTVLSLQDREDITASAQHALRLIAFRQIHKVLDMEPLSLKPTVVPVVPVPTEEDKSANMRKRRHSGEQEESVDLATLKKDKKEGETDDEDVTAT